MTEIVQAYVFVLAGFVGYLVITRVPQLLHTPLMSATNAISAISLVGSLVAAGSAVVDLAAESGGNCALTRPGETGEVGGGAVLGRLGLLATVPFHTRQTPPRSRCSPSSASWVGPCAASSAPGRWPVTCARPAPSCWPRASWERSSLPTPPSLRLRPLSRAIPGRAWAS